MPLHNEHKRKRQRVDDNESYSTQEDKAATQANDRAHQDDDSFSQDDSDSSQDDEDVLRRHKRIFLGKSIPDHEAAEKPRETYHNLFRSLEHMWLRLRQLGESPSSSRNTSDEDAGELGTLAKEMGILHARIVQMEQNAGIRYRFKSREEIMALKVKRPSYPFVCLAAECKKYFKREDRLRLHIRKKRSAEHKFLSSIISNTFCYQCGKSFSPSNFTVHARKRHEETSPKLELFQDLIVSMNQDFDHEAEHRKASVMEGRSPSSSPCSDTTLDAHCVQAQKEQHTLDPQWTHSDFTVAHTLAPEWTHSDFAAPERQHNFNPVWMGSGSFTAYSMNLSSPHLTGMEPDDSYPLHAAPSSSGFADTDIRGRVEVGHADSRPFERQYDSSGVQCASGHNPSQTDLSWTSYAEQGTIQGLQDPGSSQIVQTQTVSSQSFGNVKTLNAADELAAAKAEQATWEEVMSVRERTEDLKRIVQGVDMHSSQQLETLTVLPHQYIDCV